MTTHIDRWLTRRTSSRPIAAARAIFAVAVLLKAWDIRDKLVHLTGDEGLLIPYVPFTPTPSEPIVHVLLAAWTVGGLGLLLGAWSRWSAALVTAAIAATFLLDQQLYSNHLYLMLVLAPLFTIADTGARWSIDARRVSERTTVPAWPIDLLKVQLSLVYGFAAVSKLNAEYLSGEVLDVYITALGPVGFPPSWETSTVMSTLAVASVAIEAYLAIGFWIGRRNRWIALALGVVFHAAIVATMRSRLGLTVFSLEMFALYALFFPWTYARSGRAPAGAPDDVD